MILYICRTSLPDCWAFGKLQVTTLTPEVTETLKEQLGIEVETGLKFYRMKIDGRIYHSNEYRHVTRRNSYSICYLEGSEEKFAVIRYFLFVNTCTVAVVTLLTTSSHYCYTPEIPILCSRVVPVISEDDISVISVSSIVCKCVYIDVEGSVFLARPPNFLYCD